MKEKEILVSVLCPTYNQATYVRTCLDSIVAQQCSFGFEILVNDDASTDGTADIVSEYAARHPALIRAFLQTENQFTQGVDIIRDILLPEARGKYIAICEGDDYWTNPLKLQHQADLMEADNDVGLVYTYFYKYSERRQERFDFHFHAHEGDVYPYILASRCSIWYVTVMMRRALMCSAPRLDTSRYFTGDVFWYYWVTSHSKARLLREYTAVYRVLDTSVSHFTKRRKKIDFFFKSSQTRIFFARQYPPQGHAFLRGSVLRKSLVNYFKYALAHDDYRLMQQERIPLFPLMSVKKSIYCLLRMACVNVTVFHALSKRYNRYLDHRDQRHEHRV